MEPVYLQWNIVNWITVVLMATVGMLIIGAIGSGFRAYRKMGGAITDGND